VRHVANETNDPVDSGSDDSTRVIVADDAAEVRRSTMTVQVDDDLVKLASQLPAANKVFALKALGAFFFIEYVHARFLG
jgi:hypothetical protein